MLKKFKKWSDPNRTNRTAEPPLFYVLHICTQLYKPNSKEIGSVVCEIFVPENFCFPYIFFFIAIVLTGLINSQMVVMIINLQLSQVTIVTYNGVLL